MSLDRRNFLKAAAILPAAALVPAVLTGEEVEQVEPIKKEAERVPLVGEILRHGKCEEWQSYWTTWTEVYERHHERVRAEIKGLTKVWTYKGWLVAGVPKFVIRLTFIGFTYVGGRAPLVKNDRTRWYKLWEKEDREGAEAVLASQTKHYQGGSIKLSRFVDSSGMEQEQQHLVGMLPEKVRARLIWETHCTDGQIINYSFCDTEQPARLLCPDETTVRWETRNRSGDTFARCMDRIREMCSTLLFQGKT